MPTCEIVIHERTPGKGRAMLLSMAMAQPDNVQCTITQGYTGRSDMVMIYGLGKSPNRVIVNKYIRRGRIAIIWDLGYWGRQDEPPCCRLSINEPHPTREHFTKTPYYGRQHPQLQDLYNKDGHVLLTSSLPKSADKDHTQAAPLLRQYAEIRRLMIGRPVVYKPKHGRPRVIEDLPIVEGPLEKALEGSSLVVTQSGNLGVDAAVLGIPCVCTGGIAAHFWPNRIQAAFRPTEQERQAFLNKVAWWNWAPHEASKAWQFIRSICEF